MAVCIGLRCGRKSVSGLKSNHSSMREVLGQAMQPPRGDRLGFGLLCLAPSRAVAMFALNAVWWPVRGMGRLVVGRVVRFVGEPL